MFDNRCNLIAVVLGGITQERESFYDFNPNERISSFMVYCQQMSGIYNNMAALSQAYRAGQAKSEFMANLSHEMRTPMNAILGMTQIAKREEMTPEIKKALDQIEISSSHLLGLINDVLDISKIEEGKLSLHNEPFSLTDVLDSLFGGQKQAAINRRIDLRLHYRDLNHTRFIGDSMRLAQVIINLISNAIKFTPEDGAVSLTAERLSQNNEAVLVKFTVEDNGIGIAPERQQSIFSPFEQADNSISRRFGGTGLGLTISRRIVEMMGGEIKVNSEEGSGSTFYFSIWLTKDESARVTEQDADITMYDFTGLRTLVVDDIEINREIIDAFFEGTNMELDTADNGEKAVSAVSASPLGYYDVILMDVQMPMMDGYAATKAIRSLDRPDVKDMIIIAMTANVFKEDIEQAHKAGMNDHVGKPIECDVLFSTIQNKLKKRALMTKYSDAKCSASIPLP
ncbi:MAG: response regulator [Synergistaceae bacterium]|nr:response regulator [Synergistaceae bacterium]